MIINEIVFAGLCAMLLFMPLPFGADVPWAVFVFECATVVLAALHLAGLSVRHSPVFYNHGRVRRKWTPGQSPGHRLARGCGPMRPPRPPWPASLKALLLIFAAVSAFQFVPLPQAVLKILSPRTAALLQAVGAEGPRPLTLAPMLSFGDAVLYACYALFAFLVYRCVGTRKRAEIFTIVLIASAVFQSFYGMVELFSGTQKIFGFQRTFHLGSATGTYINRDHFSGFLEMLFPLAVGYLLAKADFFRFKKGLSLREKLVWFGQEPLQKSLVFGFLAVIVGLGIVFSHSRAGLFIFFATTFLMAAALAVAGKARRGVRLVQVVGIAVVFTALLIGIGPMIERFTSQDLTKDGRWINYENTWKYVRDFPALGTGLRTFARVYPMFETKYAQGLLDHAHNDYLEVLAESGVIGGGALILFVLGGVGWVFSKWLKRRDSFARGIGLGALAGVVALLLHSFFDFNLRIPANAVYFVTLFALAARAVDIKRYQEPGEMTRNKTIVTVGAALGLIVLFVTAVRDYAGTRAIGQYGEARSRVLNIQRGLPELEPSVRKAVRIWPRRLFLEELGRLYFDGALAEIQSGTEEKREALLDKARDAFLDEIRRYPVAADGYYNLGRVYMLYNYPYLTYAAKGREYLRKALYLQPVDEFLNTNFLAVALSQWNMLDPSEREDVRSRLRNILDHNESFVAKIREVWKQNHASVDDLIKILSADAELWPRLQKFF